MVAVYSPSAGSAIPPNHKYKPMPLAAGSLVGERSSSWVTNYRVCHLHCCFPQLKFSELHRPSSSQSYSWSRAKLYILEIQTNAISCGLYHLHCCFPQPRLPKFLFRELHKHMRGILSLELYF